MFTPPDTLEIYANYGQGFNLPGLNSGLFFTQTNLQLTKREQYELDFRASPFELVEFGSVFYLANTKNDAQRNPDTRRTENAGQTRRSGLETYVKFFPLKSLTVSSDYTYQEAKYRKNLNTVLERRRLANTPLDTFLTPKSPTSLP